MTPKLSEQRLAVLGTGKLGGRLLRAYLKQGLFSHKQVTATVRTRKKPLRCRKNSVSTSPRTIAAL